jgi:prophage antirepressor-like protein
MNSIIDIYNNILKYNNKIINFVIDKDEIIWFKFSSICKILNYKSSKDALRDHIFNKDKIKLKNLKLYFKIKDQPNTIYINESGLYTFLFKSRMKKALEFQLWMVNEVLPNLRKYGKYEVNKKIKNKLKNLNSKIKELQKSNEILKNNMTKNKYPIGGHIYVLLDEQYNKYKIGYTNNLKKRLEVYNTGKANKINFAYYKKTKCPTELELCVKALLNKYIYRSNKEFYNCSLEKIIEAISKCIKVEKKCIKCNEININNINSISMDGGGSNNIINELLNKYITKYNYYKSLLK